MQNSQIEETKIRFAFTNARALQYQPSNNKEPEVAKVMYLTGAIVQSFDVWYNSYSNDYIVIMENFPAIA